MTATSSRSHDGSHRDHTRRDRPITRDDIHAKLKELTGPVDQGVHQAKQVGIAAAVAIGAALVIGAYVFGRRKGRKRSTIVEIRRI
jgi:hypothetical protein